MTTSPASVVIPCYTEHRWPRLVAAIESALTQEPAPAEIIVVVDYNETLYERLCASFPNVSILRNASNPGVSGARNTGVSHSRTPFAVLLDDDAAAQPGWLAAMIEPFVDPEVVGVGGVIHPQWEVGRPSWFPDQMLWAVAATDPRTTEAIRVRNVWAASLAVRRETFDAVGGFRDNFGKIGHRYRPEDTDLCIRMSRHSAGHWILTPHAVVLHPVNKYRSRFGYLVARCYEEGRGKIAYARLNGADSLGSEQNYLRREVPRAVVRGLLAPFRGRGFANVLRSFVIVVAVSAAAVGGAVEWSRRDTAATYTRRQAREPRRVA